MQQSQQNYKFIYALVLVILIVPDLAWAGIVARGESDALLRDGAQGPCDPHLASPDYVPGVDVNGNPVMPADLAGRRNPVPDGVLVPLAKQGRHGQQKDGPVVAIDGRTLDPILNPPPGCAPARR